MHNHGLLSLSIEYGSTFSNLSKASYYGSMDQSDWFIDIRVINPRNEGGFSLFDQMLLDNSYATDVFDVFIESRVNGHMLGPNSEPLLVFILICNAYHERYAWWILFHHVKHEPHGEMDTLYHKWFITFLEIVNNFL